MEGSSRDYRTFADSVAYAKGTEVTRLVMLSTLDTLSIVSDSEDGPFQ